LRTSIRSGMGAYFSLSMRCMCIGSRRVPAAVVIGKIPSACIVGRMAAHGKSRFDGAEVGGFMWTGKLAQVSTLPLIAISGNK
jgi:hypothetical protein